MMKIFLLGVPTLDGGFPLDPHPGHFFSFFIVLKIKVYLITGGILNLMRYIIKSQEILAVVIDDHFCSKHRVVLGPDPLPQPHLL